MASIIIKYATTNNLNVTQVNINLVGISPGLFVVDGQTPNVNELVLVKDQIDLTQNGLYKITNTGTNVTPFILTRDTKGLYNPLGTIYYVTNGDDNNHLAWCTKSTDEIFTCGMSPLICEPLGQYTNTNNTLSGLGTPDSLLSVNISSKSTNKIMTGLDGLCVEHISNDTIIGEGTSLSPYKVLVSEDEDNILSFGSDGGILGRVNITDTTQKVTTSFNGFDVAISTDIHYNLRGQVITVEIDTIDGISNSGVFNALGVIPLHLRPSFLLKKVCYVLDNGVESLGTITFNSNGDISVYVNLGSSFMASGVKRLDHFSCSYLKK